MNELAPRLGAPAADALIGEALDRLYAAERGCPPDLHERSMAGLFLVHLRSALAARRDLGSWSVDPEYNRLGKGRDSKVLHRLADHSAIVARELGWPLTALARATDRVVPDVIVHRRGSGRGSGNLIVCEFKRSGARIRAIAADLLKLAGYLDELGYEHAYLITSGETRETCVMHRASSDLSEIIDYLRRLEEPARIRRWKRGHEMAEQRQRVLQAQEGPRPSVAVAESLSALNALDEMGVWPGPRDPVSEQAVDRVRRRWALVQRRARQARAR